MPLRGIDHFQGAVSDAPGDQGTGSRVPLPVLGVLICAGVRVLGLVVASFLLPHGRFHRLHYSLAHLIVSWDSGRYRIIATHGYSYVPGKLGHNSIFAWFPGYPLSIDTISWIPGVGVTRAGFAITVAAGLAAAWGLTRLGMALTGDRRLSLVMVALWSVAPGSIVLSMLYSEALFCALAIWSLVALVDRRWLMAGGLAFLAGMVRSAGIALVVAIAVTALPTLIAALRARQPVAMWWRPAVALLLSPLGLLGYWAYSARATHHLGGFAWVEQYLHNNFDGGKGIILALKQVLFGWPPTSAVLTLVVLAVAVALTICSLTERFPLGVHAYTLAVVVIALGVGPYYLGSKPRFLLPAVLLTVPLARLLARARTWLLVPLTAVLCAASVWFSLFLMSAGWAP